LSVDLNLLFLPSRAKFYLRVTMCCVLCVPHGLSQKTQPDRDAQPKYDVQSEVTIKGIVAEVALVSLGTRKDFVELTVKSGDDNVTIYLCPQPFQEEIGISFKKGDEIVVTGSKVKKEASDVILARELVQGTDTIQFRDDKGKPVWDERTGK
jgi:hypothetical protein